MKIRDFETAICALDCPIELDEVKLQGGHVRRFYGHRAPLLVYAVEANKAYKGGQLLMWDEFGRAYSCLLNTVGSQEIQHDTHEGVTESCYERDTVFDLKFD